MKNPVDTLVATGGSPVARPPGDSRAGRPYGAVAGCFLLCSLFGLAGCGRSADKAGDKDEPSPVPVRVARAEEPGNGSAENDLFLDVIVHREAQS